MELAPSQEDELFRVEAKKFLAESLTEHLREAGRKRTSLWQEIDSSMQWQRILHAKGWVAPDWPVEYGGTDWMLSQRYIFAQECARGEAPGLVPMSLKMCGPLLVGYGTPEQKAYYLPRILSGEDIWCQGYSEPASGSDLASLTTSAISDGDDYVVNGSKIWTSYAQHANMMFALVGTSTKGKVQQGISFLLIEMDSPGISVMPIINLEGVHEFNQVFFDDVRVPKSQRIGEENDGWSVAKYLLEFERFAMSSVELQRVLGKAEALAKLTTLDGRTLVDDAQFQRSINQLKIDAMALEASEQRVLANLSAGKRAGAVSSVLNTRSAETLQRADQLGVEVAADYGLPYQPEALAVGSLEPPIGPPGAITMMPSYLSNPMKTIARGSSEIQRNIIAKAILRL
ncbi:MAG: alkylation response protein AidB-like acyl-CoA dehydrogenase [Gammaproteobacteria bacterium]|jgi:alkylation response protein AidB-like acyl-CoA dehydrogenase